MWVRNLDHDDDDVVTLDFASGPSDHPMAEVRVTPGGIPYRAPDPQKKVVDLEEDCGLILFDAVFFQQLPEYARTFMDEGNSILNAEWKRKNLLQFRRPWRPSYRLPN